MTINIFILKGDLNGENRSGAFLFCRVYFGRQEALLIKYDQEIPKSQTTDQNTATHINVALAVKRQQEHISTQHAQLNSKSLYSLKVIKTIRGTT